MLFDILVGAEGPLIQEFERLGKVYVLGKEERQPATHKNRIEGYLRRKFLKPSKVLLAPFLPSEVLQQSYILVFSNTITNGYILRALENSGCKVVTYVHELQNAIKTFTTPDALQLTLNLSHHFLYPSVAVKDNLVNHHAIDESRLSFLPYYIPETLPTRESIALIKNALGAGEDVIIGAVGTSDWRKGVDLFIQLALHIKKKFDHRSIKFLWVGAAMGGVEFDRLMHDVNKAGLGDTLIMKGSQELPIHYMATMDVFLLPSREDPYPLVVLEAAMLGKPVVCFEGSGGAPEFLANGCGLMVPYLDVPAMAEAVIRLVEDKALAFELGMNARKKYKAIHSEDAALVIFENYIDNFTS